MVWQLDLGVRILLKPSSNIDQKTPPVAISLILATWFLSSLGCVLAAEVTFHSQQDFDRWTKHYYLMPEPGKIPTAMSYYCASSLFQEEDTRMPMTAFFAAVFQKDPSIMEITFQDVSMRGTESAKIFILNALWLANNPTSQAFLNQAKQKWLSKKVQNVLVRMGNQRPVDILQGRVTEAAQLDMLWAMFSATGDPAVVQKIISVITWKEEGSGFNILLGGAASWSLASNAQQHPRVYAICKEELRTSTGTERKLLEDIVHNTKIITASKTN